MQPTRHALAALILEQDRVEEATAVYRADLGYDGTLSRACQHPDNVWNLHGYHECLGRLGRSSEAVIVEPGRPAAVRRRRSTLHVRGSNGGQGGRRDQDGQHGCEFEADRSPQPNTGPGIAGKKGRGES